MDNLDEVGVARVEFIRGCLSQGVTSNEEMAKIWNAAHPEYLATDEEIASLRNPLVEFIESRGLEQHFSDQASLVLSQYRAIEHLLGPPEKEWTWIGEHCESLIRTALRRILPRSFEIRKGYIHGVSVSTSGVKRCPEVDILVWDADLSPPIFELDNFVIVKPESVRAVIQVKRTISRSTLKKGILNVVQAKRHVLTTASDSSGLSRIFSAVLGIETDPELFSKGDKVSASYRNSLQKHYCDVSDSWLMPDFIGSLSSQFMVKTSEVGTDPKYVTADSIQSDKNAAMTMLLYCVSRKLLSDPVLDQTPRSIKPKGVFVLRCPAPAGSVESKKKQSSKRKRSSKKK